MPNRSAGGRSSSPSGTPRKNAAAKSTALTSSSSSPSTDAAARLAENEALKQLRELTLPNVITLANAACGFLALVLASYEKTGMACICVWISAFLDALDGRVARWTETTTLLGKELDSLADTVTFVVVPAFLLFEGGKKAAQEAGNYTLAALFAACCSFVLAGVFRLARFNVTAQQQSLMFLGIPTTLAAMTSSALLATFEEQEYALTRTITTAILAYLMISRWNFPTYKDASSGFIAAILIPIIAFAFYVGSASAAGLLLTGGYLVSGIFSNLVRAIGIKG